MAELKIKADSGGGTVSFKGPATTTSNAAVQLTLPVDDGTSGQYLKTDGSGALSWATVASVGGGTGVDFNDSVKTRWGTDNDLEMYHDNSNSYIKHANNGSLEIECTNSGHIILKPDGEVQVGDAKNLKIADGNLVIGTAGKGIDFSATADGGSGNTNNELLNDYEEGGFTPTISLPTGTGAVATNNCARYQKVGNAVHIWGYFAIDWSEDAAGEITFGGLPYATANLTAGVGGGCCLAQGSHNVTTNLMKFCILNLVQNSSTFKLFKQVDIDSVERLTVADCNYEPNDSTQFYGVDFNYLTMPSGLWY